MCVSDWLLIYRIVSRHVHVGKEFSSEAKKYDTVHTYLCNHRQHGSFTFYRKFYSAINSGRSAPSSAFALLCLEYVPYVTIMPGTGMQAKPVCHTVVDPAFCRCCRHSFRILVRFPATTQRNYGIHTYKKNAARCALLRTLLRHAERQTTIVYGYHGIHGTLCGYRIHPIRRRLCYRHRRHGRGRIRALQSLRIRRMRYSGILLWLYPSCGTYCRTCTGFYAGDRNALVSVLSRRSRSCCWIGGALRAVCWLNACCCCSSLLAFKGATGVNLWWASRWSSPIVVSNECENSKIARSPL